MRLRRIAFCSLLLAAGVSGRAPGQQLAAPVVQEINAATNARVRLLAGDRGMLFAPRADSIGVTYEHSEFLNRGGTVVQLPPPLQVAQFAEIQVPEGSTAGSGAKIGGGIGAGLALLAVALTAGQDFVSPSPGEAVGAVVGWTLIGAGVGALIGSASPRWKTIYVAR